MRNRPLHDALREFAIESARLLSAALDEGAELAFEVAEHPASGTTLYRYRPLTAEFIGARWDDLRALPSFGAGVAALGAGAAVYLRARGGQGDDAEPALRAMLERLYDDRTDFAFPEERFERAYGEVERALYSSRLPATVVAPLEGVRIEVGRVELGDGLALVRGDAVEAPRQGLADWEPLTLCVLEREVTTDALAPVAEARALFAQILRAMRLLKTGAAMLDPLSWVSVDESPWRPVSLGVQGRGRGAAWTLPAAEVGELQELVDLVAGPPPPGPVRWALARFEMGCGRGTDTEALTDHLLALRALFDGWEDMGAAALPLRVAALCAEEPARRPVQRRVELAFALERYVVAGSGEDYADAIGSESPRQLASEVEEHTRGLLRDVVCGYLPAHLTMAADELLIDGSDPIEIRAEDTRALPLEWEGDLADDPAGLDQEWDRDLEDDPGEHEPDWDGVPNPRIESERDGFEHQRDPGSEPDVAEQPAAYAASAPEPEEPGAYKAPVPERHEELRTEATSNGWVATAGLPPQREDRGRLADWDFEP